MFELSSIITIVKIVIAVSIFFVWIIRYSNIVEEFQEYALPNWFRDIMGIIKCSSAVMLLIGTAYLSILAASVLSILMFAAFMVHIKHKHSFIQMLPSLSLTIANSAILYQSLITIA